MAAKLVFYHGCVSSSKTMLLLAISHNYDTAGWSVITIKPALDTRSELIETRAKVPPRKADIILDNSESIYDYKEVLNNADVILIDECQFLTENQINELREFSVDHAIDVICFGLRTDFNTHLFPATKRILELADEITEVKTICQVCGKHASFNKRVIAKSNNTEFVIDPGWENFKPVCWKHYRES